MSAKRIFILGIPLDILSSEELKRRLLEILQQRRGRQLVTPNPEFLLLAQEEREFFSVLREATLAIPDGIGLKFAGWLKGVNIIRHTGADMVRWLLHVAERRGYRVAILNWRYGLSTAEVIRTTLKKKHPNLSLFIEDIDPERPYNLQRLQRFRPTILFTTFGAPQQDIFIARHKRHLPTLRLGMGVGGSFDFLTKRLRRAPRLMRFLGFEWLWRLTQQPLTVKRWRRIMQAVVVFPWTVLRWEGRRFYFRPNVVALIINSAEQVLILNARGRGDYWGLPQGGRERGESIEVATRREVEEETGLTDLTMITCFKNIYHYTWSKPYTYKGYKGQRQTLCVLRYEGPNNAVRTNRFEHKAYRWVKLEDLVKSTSPVHKKQYELFLQKYRETLS